MKMMDVETASSITFATISSIMELRDWEVAIEIDFDAERQATLQLWLLVQILTDIHRLALGRTTHFIGIL